MNASIEGKITVSLDDDDIEGMKRGALEYELAKGLKIRIEYKVPFGTEDAKQKSSKSIEVAEKPKKKKRGLSDEDKAKIIEMEKAGKKMAEIIKVTGLTRGQVNSFLYAYRKKNR